MTRSLLMLAAGVAVFAVGLWRFLQLRSDPPPALTPAAARYVPTSTPRSTSITGGRSATRVVHIVVEGLNFAFSPASITVRAGTTVTWVSRTASPHTITSVTRKLFDVSIRGRGRAQIQFLHPGTYQYYCALHPYMLGVIHVRG
jgi:plastocyanin